MEKRECGTCQWYDRETEVCCNGRSDYRADFLSHDDTCGEWEGDPPPEAVAKSE